MAKSNTTLHLKRKSQIRYLYIYIYLDPLPCEGLEAGKSFQRFAFLFIFYHFQPVFEKTRGKGKGKGGKGGGATRQTTKFGLPYDLIICILLYSSFFRVRRSIA